MNAPRLALRHRAGPTPSTQCLYQTRNASSARRHKPFLRVKPDPSFTSATGTQDHIIYNPPSSAPNVYHTPQKFLPKDDPRRRLHTLISPPTNPDAKLPPSLRPVTEQKYHLSAEEIAEMKRLREEDPRQWTRVRLAEKYGCSQFFVSLCCSAPQIKEERDKLMDEIRSKWGRGRKEAREDRNIRKERWGRGE